MVIVVLVTVIIKTVIIILFFFLLFMCSHNIHKVTYKGNRGIIRKNASLTVKQSIREHKPRHVENIRV
jgi:hypothetical protein